MYQKLIITALLSATLVFSCKKKEDAVEETPVETTTGDSNPLLKIDKIKTEERIANGVTLKIEYTYGSDGKVTKMDYGDGNFSAVEWSTIKCLRKEFNKGNSLPVSTIEYNLNSAGLCSGQTGENGFSTSYEYDANGYQVKFTFKTSGSEVSSNYIISSGNQTGVSSGSGTTAMTGTTEYFLDKTNTIGDHNKGMPIFGTQNKNLQKKIITTVAGSTNVTTISYEFDSKNRVAKMTQIGSGATSVNNYTYY